MTLIGYSLMVRKCLAAAERLEREGISCEVLDLRTLTPLDMDTIAASVARTHRVVVTQEEWLNAGFAAEIAARLADVCFDELGRSHQSAWAGPMCPCPTPRSWSRLPSRA